MFLELIQKKEMKRESSEMAIWRARNFSNYDERGDERLPYKGLD